MRWSIAISRYGWRTGAHIVVICKDLKTSHLSRGLFQICDELGGLGGVGGLGDDLESGSEDERESGEELHGEIHVRAVRKGDGRRGDKKTKRGMGDCPCLGV